MFLPLGGALPAPCRSAPSSGAWAPLPARPSSPPPPLAHGAAGLCAHARSEPAGAEGTSRVRAAMGVRV